MKRAPRVISLQREGCDLKEASVLVALCLAMVSAGVIAGVWLLGLIVVLRGTTPAERPRIIAAYGRAWPGRWGWRVRGGPPAS